MHGNGYLGRSCVVSPSGKWIASNTAYEWYFNVERNHIIWDSQTRMIRTTIEGRHQVLSFLPSRNGLEDYIVLLERGFELDRYGNQSKLVVWDHFHGTLVATLENGARLDLSYNAYVEATGDS